MFVSDIINIVDTQTPIMVMVGPSGSGKTMVTYRLLAWLVNRGYHVDVDRILYPATFTRYQQFASDFYSTVFSHSPCLSTQHLALYKVCDKKGYPILQVFDSPGYEWFDINNESLFHGFHSPQINQMISCPNKKIWIYFTEPNWGTIADRNYYVESIRHLHVVTSRKDKHIVLLNKVDEIIPFTSHGYPLMIKDMRIERFLGTQYPALLETIRNKDFFSKWIRKHFCNILPFSTGSYYDTTQSSVEYCPSSDIYPATLWKRICKNIKHKH